MDIETVDLLHLTKHEGTGNDFLVLVDLDDSTRLSNVEVARLCDRRRGVGADGLIRILASPGLADVAMELRNADGGVAETSGNGLRCLAQAAVDAGVVESPRFSVATGDRVATVEFKPTDVTGLAWATVDMGPVELVGPTMREGSGRQAQRVHTGNPHLVVACEDPSAVDVLGQGAALGADYPDGINVEFVAFGPRSDELTMRVFERGVGETWACGTGSCAAAAAARSWGLVGDRVVVRNPGGPLEVVLGPKDGDSASLRGPVRRIATITVERNVLR